MIVDSEVLVTVRYEVSSSVIVAPGPLTVSVVVTTEVLTTGAPAEAVLVTVT